MMEETRNLAEAVALRATAPSSGVPSGRHLLPQGEKGSPNL